MRHGTVWTAGAALLVAGCSGPVDDRAILRADVVGSLDEPASLPRIALTQATQLGLVQFDGAGQIVPGLAASWRVVDSGRSLIFRLRPATWSDGRGARRQRRRRRLPSDHAAGQPQSAQAIVIGHRQRRIGRRRTRSGGAARRDRAAAQCR